MAVEEVFPIPRSLGAAENWGRHVELRVQGSENVLLQTNQSLENLNRSFSAQLTQSASQIEIINSVLQSLGGQQDQLSGVVDDLVLQQTQLNNQQTQLTNLVNAIPVTDSNSGTISNFSVPSGTSNRLTVNFTVPAGKTQCTMFAVGQAFWFAPNPPVPNSDIAVWRVRIGTNDGPFGVVVPMNMDGKSSTVMHSRTYSVTPGSTQPVYLRTSAPRAQGTFPENSASLFAIATFS